MSSSSVPIEVLKQRMKATWMAGDFGQVAHYAETAAKNFVDQLPIQAGMRLLDVACGTGNTSIPAARKGASVTGVDIASNLLDQARKRASDEGLAIEFRGGDAEELPFPDAHFDVVLSMFGAMFAPRPEIAAAELVRVCRPDGLIAMANWTAEGFVGKTFIVTSSHVPPPPGVPAPLLWGNEKTVRERFAKSGRKVQTFRRELEFRFPFDCKSTVAFFRQYFGPTQMAFSRLDPKGQDALAQDLEKVWSENKRGSANETVVTAEYLEVRVTP